ncbi:hypothetical protein K458DRAFT_46854 [Lentithecium fluviatile CBS 122367]|uniref:NACHT domain-containing protein n=1 Tax=Lentithecium fluviatile CBS 122367 TaxID=1168545 RepID=A0A6G1IYY7_9PLEO|nr:hypothetical protein K458DRAFT_46854 [Lentithecium fluviatile CBS 122367]
MPQPLLTVGLATALVQTIDFSANILSENHAIYPSSDGASPDNHTVLRDITNNFHRLSFRISENDAKRRGAEKKNAKLSEAEQHLLKLSDELRELVDPLRDAFLHVQPRGSYSDPKWGSAREALLTVWKEKDITNLLKKLKNVKKEVDTTLLFALRQHLDQSTEKGVLMTSVHDPKTHHWERWQIDAINSIHTNAWKPKNRKHVEEFSKHVDALVLAENKAHFCREVFAHLHFVEQDDRLQSISTPHEGSFDWVLDPRHEKQASLLKWLGDTSGKNLFWMTGKPGCGKSTLMKHLFRNERLFPQLEEWSGQLPGFLTGCFLWNCGNELQKSSIGLLNTLLYETLQDMIYGPYKQDPGIVPWLFNDRWNQFLSYGGGLNPFTLPELRAAFDLLISDASKKFLFMIDGLDEIEEGPSTLLDIFLTAAQRENVKMCVSSRKAPIFQQAFNGCPSLEVDRYTRGGILSCVLYAFDQNDTMFSIPAEDSDGTEERAIINMIVEKSAGVFLWASLATEILLQDVKETDDVATIRARVDALPFDVKDLIAYIVDSLDIQQLEQAARLIRLLEAHGYPNLLPLCFAADVDTTSGLAAEARPLTSLEVLTTIDDMRNLLKFKCKTLLAIFEAGPMDEARSDKVDLKNFRVNYMHRCIRDFLRSETIRGRVKEATHYDALNTDENWANAHLWTLKTLTPRNDNMPIWDALTNCIEYALRLEAASKCIRLTYLDEVSAALTHHLSIYLLADMDFPPGATVQSFLDIAVLLNLSGYVAIKTDKAADRKEIRHAMDYAKDVRKVIDAGGEEKWLGKRAMLREAYSSSSPPELAALLEYHTKSVRFSTQKPFVELPEWV